MFVCVCVLSLRRIKLMLFCLMQRVYLNQCLYLNVSPPFAWAIPRQEIYSHLFTFYAPGFNDP